MATDDVTPLRDERAFLTALHATRFYFLVFDRQLQREWDAAVDAFVREQVIPRLADEQFRTAYEGGFPTTMLTMGPALEANNIYDEEFPTQRDYVGSLSRFVDELVGQADTALLAALLRLHIRIGNALADQASLTVQDRYFLPFLLLLRAPTIPLPLLDEVLDGIDDSSARALLRRASGHPETLVARERLALALFDMILLREDEGFDIKLADIARAKQLVHEIPLRDTRTTAHPSHAAWTDLVGTFEGNLAAEIFKFFNAGLLAHAPQDEFHAFCLRAWTLLQPDLDADGRDAVLEALADGFRVERDREIPLLEAYRAAAEGEAVDDPDADGADVEERIRRLFFAPNLARMRAGIALAVAQGQSDIWERLAADAGVTISDSGTLTIDDDGTVARTADPQEAGLWLLRCTGQLDHVTELNLYDSALEVCEVFAGLPVLETLGLQYCSHVRDLTGLDTIPRLRSLSLWGSDALADLGTIATMPALETLDLLRNPALRSIAPVWRCRTLRDLSLRDIPEGVALAPPETIATITALHLGNCDDLTELSLLRSFPNLRRLTLGGCTHLTDIAAVSACATLCEIDIDLCPEVTDFVAIESLPDLETVRVTNSGLSSLASLPCRPTVQELDLHGCESLTTLDGLEGWSALQTIDLAGCLGLETIAPIRQATTVTAVSLPAERLADFAEDAQGLPESVSIDWVLDGDWSRASVDLAVYTDLLALLSGPDESLVRQGLAMYEAGSSPVGDAWALLARGVELGEGGEITLTADSIIGRCVPDEFQPEVALRALCGEMWSEGGRSRVSDCTDLTIAVPTLRSLYVFDGYWLPGAPPPELRRLDLGACEALESLEGIAQLPNIDTLILPAGRRVALRDAVRGLPSSVSVHWSPDDVVAEIEDPEPTETEDAEPSASEDAETDLPDWLKAIVDAALAETGDPTADAATDAAAEMQGPFALALDVADVINFASTHAGIPIIRRLELRNRTTEARTELTLRVTLTCDALDATAASFERRIQRLEAEDAVAFDAIPLRLDAGLLARLDEAIGGAIDVRIEEAETEVARWTHPIRLLAHNEFFHHLPMAELVAAHIQPNHPAVVPVLQAAGEHLRRTSGDSSLQGYQAGPDRARLIAAGIYEALREFKVGYVNPPASFEGTGQKIRTPAQVIDDRLGTCLDLACTYAACLEQAGLNPVLCIIKGHAYAGVFLDEDIGFRDPTMRSINTALNVLDAGKLITVETVAYTSGSDLDFDEAVAAGRTHWKDSERFRAVVDVRAARRHGVLPLPARVLRDGQVTVIVEEKVVQAAPVVVTTVQPVVAVPRDRAAAPPRIQQWKKSLLDLSLRNPLLNLNTKRSGLGVLVPTDALALVEDILMGGHGLRLFAHDQLTQLHRERGARSVADIDAVVRRELLTKERMLHVDASEDALARRLRGLREKARLAEEEGGTNILHLTIGSLHWTDPVKGKTVRSPILLLPVRLHAMGRGKPMELRADPVGGTVHNFVLLEKLRQTFRLQVPELERLTDDASGVDVIRALDGLRAAIARDELDMRVDDDAAIALLQFGKYRMWKDLDDHWERFLENPVVRHLVERPGQPFQRPVPLPDVATLDDEPVFCPIPCDGTQLEAIVAAAKGASFVLEGPPGTGKSQTITNMIANALAAGKRVLFVAEKRAALTVVKNRLTAVGLGPFCLDVHGKGTDLESLKTQLASSFNRVANGDPAEWEGTRRDLTDRMGTLRAYVQALHETGAHGFSVWTARQRLMSLGEGPALRPAGGALAPEAFDAVRKLVSDFADRYAAATAAPGGNPWGFVEDGAVADQVESETLRDVLQGVRSALSALEPSVVDVLRPLDAVALAAVATLQSALTGLSAPQRQGILALSSAADAPYARLLEALHALERSATAVDQWFRPSIQTADPARLRATLEAARTSFLLGRGGRIRQAMTAIAPHLRRSGATEADVVRALGEAADLAARAAEVSAQARVVLGATLPPDWAVLAPESLVVVERLVQARRALAEAAQGPAGPVLDGVLRVLPPGVEVGKALETLLEKLTAFRAQLGVSELTFAALVREGGIIGTLIDRLPAWQADAERGFLQLRRWSVVATTLDRLTASGFSARGELQAGRLEAAAVASAVERGNVRAAFDERMRASRLDRFDGLEHQRDLTRYQALYATDAQMLKEVIPDRLLRARRFKPGEAFGEVGNLKRNVLDARKAKLSIRQLLKQYCKAIGELTPCFLMSPDSVAQFIEPGVLDFDLVIFDEASQVSVPDAIGAIARGRSLVVVGDSRQMPPTAFFGSGAGDEEDAPAPVDGVELAVPEDLESILSECVGANIDRIWLSWHYRSQAESLIAFSNAKYYEGRLASFPPPRVTGGAAGVRWCKVPDAIFDRGRTATNPKEADAVVAEIQARLRAAGDRAASMGVVTFNINQADLISERLEAAALGDKALDAVLKEEDPERRLFVKNLENVQGDERDVILISIGFGRDRDGEFLMNFGPLNRAGGERRWNVAVTRARQEVMLFSSIEPEEIDLARVGAGADGVRHLRAYMELARDGVSRLGDVAALGQHGPDAHRETIAEALRAAGLQVDTDIGLSSFKVDLALAHPEAPERQLVAVLLDGPTYARRRTVQDREGLPVSVLERLMKWDTTFRIWLPQWNAEPERVIEDVKQLVERLHAKAATAPAPVGPSEMGPTTGSRKTLAGRVVLTPAADVRLAAPEFRSYEVRLGDLGDTAALEAAIARPGAGVLLRAADDILAIEGPTEMTRLGRLLGRRFGLERVRGDRITAMIAVLPRERLRTAGERTFVWPQDLTPGTWRGFRRTPPGCDRPLECIAPEEVRNAILEIATKGLSVTDGDIVDALAELFGILRVTTSIRSDLLTHLRSAVADGVLRQAGDRYEVAS